MQYADSQTPANASNRYGARPAISHTRIRIRRCCDGGSETDSLQHLMYLPVLASWGARLRKQVRSAHEGKRVKENAKTRHLAILPCAQHARRPLASCEAPGPILHRVIGADADRPAPPAQRGSCGRGASCCPRHAAAMSRRHARAIPAWESMHARTASDVSAEQGAAEGEGRKRRTRKRSCHALLVATITTLLLYQRSSSCMLYSCTCYSIFHLRCAVQFPDRANAPTEAGSFSFHNTYKYDQSSQPQTLPVRRPYFTAFSVLQPDSIWKKRSDQC